MLPHFTILNCYVSKFNSVFNFSMRHQINTWNMLSYFSIIIPYLPWNIFRPCRSIICPLNAQYFCVNSTFQRMYVVSELSYRLFFQCDSKNYDLDRNRRHYLKSLFVILFSLEFRKNTLFPEFLIPRENATMSTETFLNFSYLLFIFLPPEFPDNFEILGNTGRKIFSYLSEDLFFY